MLYTFMTFLRYVIFSKAMSNEMDLAECGIKQKAFIKGRGAEVLWQCPAVSHLVRAL
jgi:hypothetical protein